MGILLYGCGDFLTKRLKAYLDENFLSLVDFTDSDEKKWGSRIFDKEILSVGKIDMGSYKFVINGSVKQADSVMKSCMELGFAKSSIIPVSFLECYVSKWKKTAVSGEWKKAFENDNFMVIKNWYALNGKLECMVRLSGLRDYDVQFNIMSLLRKKIKISLVNEITGMSLSQRFWAETGFLYHVEYNEEILRFSIEEDFYNIPWIGYEISKSRILTLIEKEKRGNHFRDIYNSMERFPYHDEDYLAVSGMDVGGGTIVDVGANFGQSMKAFYDLTQETKIISIEASPELANILRIYKDRFDGEGRVHIINAGVDKENANLTWYEPEGNISGSFDRNFLDSRKLNLRYREKTLECFTLDELLKDEKDIRLIKIDVEGLEFRVIQGAMNLIKRYFPLLILEQNNEKQLIAEYLSEYYDLRYYNVETDTFVKNKISGINYWMIPKEQYRKTGLNRIIIQKVR